MIRGIIFASVCAILLSGFVYIASFTYATYFSQSKHLSIASVTPTISAVSSSDTSSKGLLTDEQTNTSADLTIDDTPSMLPLFRQPKKTEIITRLTEQTAVVEKAFPTPELAPITPTTVNLHETDHLQIFTTPLPSPSTYYIPENSPTLSQAVTPSLSKKMLEEVTFIGQVEEENNQYVFNRNGGSILTDNQLLVQLPSDTLEHHWFHFQLKIETNETLAGYDDPCIIVMINGTPLFGASSNIAEYLDLQGWIGISLEVPKSLLFEVDEASEVHNTLTILAGDNGDVLEPTKVWIKFDGLSTSSQHSTLYSRFSTELMLEQHRGYLLTNSHVFGEPYLMSTIISQFEPASDLKAEESRDILRSNAGLYWWRDGLIGNGYALHQSSDMPEYLLIVPLAKMLAISVLPE